MVGQCAGQPVCQCSGQPAMPKTGFHTFINLPATMVCTKCQEVHHAPCRTFGLSVFKSLKPSPPLVRLGPPLVQRSIVEVSAAPLDCQSLGLKPKPPFLPTGLVIKCSLMALIPAKVGSVIFITDPVIEILPGVRQGF